jgi:hypothetical protein
MVHMSLVQVTLLWQDGVEPSWGGCELPQLVTSAGSEPQKALDMSGAVCFGDILLLERSGRVTPDPDAGEGAPAAVNLCIKVQLQVLHPIFLCTLAPVLLSRSMSLWGNGNITTISDPSQPHARTFVLPTTIPCIHVCSCVKCSAHTVL